MANPFPFVAGDVLTAAELNGIGEATTAYTPTATNFTLGNGTITGRFTQVNKLVYGLVNIVLGSTSAITGNMTISFPVTASTNSASLVVGGGFFFDTSTSETYLGFSFRSSTTAFSPWLIGSGGTFSARGIINATAPVAFANGDSITYQFTYEAA